MRVTRAASILRLVSASSTTKATSWPLVGVPAARLAADRTPDGGAGTAGVAGAAAGALAAGDAAVMAISDGVEAATAPYVAAGAADWRRAWLAGEGAALGRGGGGGGSRDAATGKRIVKKKELPWPSSDRTPILPPSCRSTIALHSARPKPEPWPFCNVLGRICTKLRNSFSWFASEMPQPWSVTTTVTSE
jgi:hypothetical protein